MKILAAGDHFVLNSLITDAITEALRREGAAPAEITELTLPWPLAPSARSPRSRRPTTRRTR